MSKFSEKCKELIKRSDTNVYQLAKYSGLERTSLQKMINGTRLPSSIEKVRKFCSYLCLSVQEEVELLELYKVEKVGKNRYDSRIEIQDFVARMEQYKSKWKSIDKYPADIKYQGEGVCDKSSIKVLEYNLDIEEVIEYVIVSEVRKETDIYISMNDFEKNNIVFQCLIAEAKNRDKQIICNHYVTLIRNNAEEISKIENIRILKKSVAFALEFSQVYKVYYSYASGEKKEKELQMWPNYILTSDKVILLSGDCTKAILIEDIDLVKGYQMGISELEKKYRELFEVDATEANTQEKMLEYYHKTKDGEPNYVFMPQIDVQHLYYMQLYKKEKENIYVSLICNMHKNRIHNSKQTTVYFGLLGLQEFIESGKVPGIYGEFLGEYSIEERRTMLNNYLKCLSEDAIQSYLLKETVFDYKTLMNIELYEGRGLYFLSTKANEAFKYIEIKEQGICIAFQDYFESLSESEEIYDVNTSQEKVRKKINHIWLNNVKKENLKG